MDHKTFGQLVAALRKEHMDEELRIWTQEKLGDETGLDERMIGRIERGKRAVLDTELLTRLAKAFQLSCMERREFFLAAVMDDDAIDQAGAEPEAELEPLLHMIKALPFPALLSDAYLNIIAANGALLKCLEIAPEALKTMAGAPAGANILRLIFAPETDLRRLLGRKWHTIAVRTLQFFRFTTLRYRTTGHFAALLKVLRGSRDFRKCWSEIDFEGRDTCRHFESYEHKHPRYGRVKYISIAAPTITRAGELYLTLCVPANNTTAQIFADIAAEAGAKAHRLAPWPEPGSDA